MRDMAGKLVLDIGKCNLNTVELQRVRGEMARQIEKLP